MNLVRTLITASLLLSMVSTATASIEPQAQTSDVAPFQIAEMALDDSMTGPRIRLDIFHDNGLVTEFAVRCGQVRGILTYSRGEQLFCGPQMRCSPSKLAVLASICRP